MRNARYLGTVMALVITMSAVGAPRDLPRDEPRIIKRIVRLIRFITQPLGDYPSPPHP